MDVTYNADFGLAGRSVFSADILKELRFSCSRGCFFLMDAEAYIPKCAFRRFPSRIAARSSGQIGSKALAPKWDTPIIFLLEFPSGSAIRLEMCAETYNAKKEGDLA